MSKGGKVIDEAKIISTKKEDKKKISSSKKVLKK
jgi:hypothetical protein